MLSQLFFNFFGATVANGPCPITYFLGIPPWYKYLVSSGRMVANNGICEVVGGFKWQAGGGKVSDIVLIIMGVLDILLRVAGLVAVGFIIYGAIQYITSDGEPSKSKDAQSTIINALIGLIIALIATTTVGFLGSKLSG